MVTRWRCYHFLASVASEVIRGQTLVSAVSQQSFRKSSRGLKKYSVICIQFEFKNVSRETYSAKTEKYRKTY